MVGSNGMWIPGFHSLPLQSTEQKIAGTNPDFSWNHNGSGGHLVETTTGDIFLVKTPN